MMICHSIVVEDGMNYSKYVKILMKEANLIKENLNI